MCGRIAPQRRSKKCAPSQAQAQKTKKRKNTALPGGVPIKNQSTKSSFFASVKFTGPFAVK